MQLKCRYSSQRLGQGVICEIFGERLISYKNTVLPGDGYLARMILRDERWIAWRPEACSETR